MVFFNYDKPVPPNFKELENDVMVTYKQAIDKFPNEDITFTWNGSRFILGVRDELLAVFHELGRDTAS